MKTVIIAMKDRHQSQKLAIVLSNMFDSRIVDTKSKLRGLFENENSDYYTVIYEDCDGDSSFSNELTKLHESGKLYNKSICLTRNGNGAQASDFTFVLAKPFGVKELIEATNKVEHVNIKSSIAIA